LGVESQRQQRQANESCYFTINKEFWLDPTVYLLTADFLSYKFLWLLFILQFILQCSQYLDYIVLNVELMVNWKGFGRKWF
jgi:hypothetical protein